MEESQSELVTFFGTVGSPIAVGRARELQMDYEMPMGDSYETNNQTVGTLVLFKPRFSKHNNK